MTRSVAIALLGIVLVASACGTASSTQTAGVDNATSTSTVYPTVNASYANEAPRVVVSLHSPSGNIRCAWVTSPTADFTACQTLNNGNVLVLPGDAAPFRPGETVIVLRDLKPGRYAIQAYQDVNANDKMDVTWFGYPLEPFGFSRDAKPRFGKPRFSQVEFALQPGENSQTLHLQHSVSLLAAE